MITVDIFEPSDLEALVKQSVPTVRTDLNHYSFADYMWTDCENHTVQVERKKIDEILSDVDHIEEQLGREIVKTDKTYLLYEGSFEPAISGGKSGTRSYHKTKDGKFLVPGHFYNASFTGVMAWMDRIDQCGITIINSMDYRTTADILVGLFRNQQKPFESHGTFQRTIKKKIFPKPTNHHVETLMGLIDEDGKSFLGESRATALIREFETVWAVMNMDAAQLANVSGIGLGTAKKLLKAIGRKDK